MAQIVVRNIDDAAMAGMRLRAKQHARSLEAEVRLLIEECGREQAEREDFWRRAEAIAASVRHLPQSDSADLRRIGRSDEEDL